MELTQSLLRELFDYREDGCLVRKVTTNYNAQAGSVAGSIQKKGYLTVRINRKPYQVHRIIFFMHHNYWPKEVDHADTNKSNNRIGNLRDASTSQNCSNQPKRKTNKSGFKGVSWHSRLGRWRAQICHKQKVQCLGYYDDPAIAASVYQEAAKRLHGEFARF